MLLDSLGTSRISSLVLSEALGTMETMPVSSLEACCYEETVRYYQRLPCDGRYGYQLFRRALVTHDPGAWEAVGRVYQGQLVRWARSHRLYEQTGEEAEEFANRALENLWRRVGPSRFDAFPNLNSILGYLQRCVQNLVIDQARMRAREQQRTQALADAMASTLGQSPQGWALDQVRAGEIWEAVRTHCRNDREEVIAYCYLVLQLKPSDILAMYPEQLGSTASINATIATLLKRLRRSPVLRSQCQEVLVGKASRRSIKGDQAAGNAAD